MRITRGAGLKKIDAWALLLGNSDLILLERGPGIFILTDPNIETDEESTDPAELLISKKKKLCDLPKFTQLVNIN